MKISKELAATLERERALYRAYGTSYVNAPEEVRDSEKIDSYLEELSKKKAATVQKEAEAKQEKALLFKQAVEENKKRLSEDRYARLLLPEVDKDGSFKEETLDNWSKRLMRTYKGVSGLSTAKALGGAAVEGSERMSNATAEAGYRMATTNDSYWQATGALNEADRNETTKNNAIFQLGDRIAAIESLKTKEKEGYTLDEARAAYLKVEEAKNAVDSLKSIPYSEAKYDAGHYERIRRLEEDYQNLKKTYGKQADSWLQLAGKMPAWAARDVASEIGEEAVTFLPWAKGAKVVAGVAGLGKAAQAGSNVAQTLSKLPVAGKIVNNSRYLATTAVENAGAGADSYYATKERLSKERPDLAPEEVERKATVAGWLSVGTNLASEQLFRLGGRTIEQRIGQNVDNSLGDVAKSVVSEGAEEALASGTETYLGNVLVDDKKWNSEEALRGVKEAAIQGGILGLATSGGINAASSAGDLGADYLTQRKIKAAEIKAPSVSVPSVAEAVKNLTTPSQQPAEAPTDVGAPALTSSPVDAVEGVPLPGRKAQPVTVQEQVDTTDTLEDFSSKVDSTLAPKISALRKQGLEDEASAMEAYGTSLKAAKESGTAPEMVKEFLKEQTRETRIEAAKAATPEAVANRIKLGTGDVEVNDIEANIERETDVAGLRFFAERQRLQARAASSQKQEDKMVAEADLADSRASMLEKKNSAVSDRKRDGIPVDASFTNTYNQTTSVGTRGVMQHTNAQGESRYTHEALPGVYFTSVTALNAAKREATKGAKPALESATKAPDKKKEEAQASIKELSKGPKAKRFKDMSLFQRMAIARQLRRSASTSETKALLSAISAGKVTLAYDTNNTAEGQIDPKSGGIAINLAEFVNKNLEDRKKDRKQLAEKASRIGRGSKKEKQKALEEFYLNNTNLLVQSSSNFMDAVRHEFRHNADIANGVRVEDLRAIDESMRDDPLWKAMKSFVEAKLYKPGSVKFQLEVMGYYITALSNMSSTPAFQPLFILATGKGVESYEDTVKHLENFNPADHFVTNAYGTVLHSDTKGFLKNYADNYTAQKKVEKEISSLGFDKAVQRDITNLAYVPNATKQTKTLARGYAKLAEGENRLVGNLFTTLPIIQDGKSNAGLLDSANLLASQEQGSVILKSNKEQSAESAAAGFSVSDTTAPKTQTEFKTLTQLGLDVEDPATDEFIKALGIKAKTMLNSSQDVFAELAGYYEEAASKKLEKLSALSSKYRNADKDTDFYPEPPKTKVFKSKQEAFDYKQAARLHKKAVNSKAYFERLVASVSTEYQNLADIAAKAAAFIEKNSTERGSSEAVDFLVKQAPRRKGKVWQKADKLLRSKILSLDNARKLVSTVREYGEATSTGQKKATLSKIKLGTVGDMRAAWFSKYIEKRPTLTKYGKLASLTTSSSDKKQYIDIQQMTYDRFSSENGRSLASAGELRYMAEVLNTVLQLESETGFEAELPVNAYGTHILKRPVFLRDGSVEEVTITYEGRRDLMAAYTANRVRSMFISLQIKQQQQYELDVARNEEKKALGLPVEPIVFKTDLATDSLANFENLEYSTFEADDGNTYSVPKFTRYDTHSPAMVAAAYRLQRGLEEFRYSIPDTDYSKAETFLASPDEDAALLAAFSELENKRRELEEVELSIDSAGATAEFEGESDTDTLDALMERWEGLMLEVDSLENDYNELSAEKTQEASNTVYDEEDVFVPTGDLLEGKYSGPNKDRASVRTAMQGKLLGQKDWSVLLEGKTKEQRRAYVSKQGRSIDNPGSREAGYYLRDAELDMTPDPALGQSFFMLNSDSNPNQVPVAADIALFEFMGGKIDTVLNSSGRHSYGTAVKNILTVDDVNAASSLLTDGKLIAKVRNALSSVPAGYVLTRALWDRKKHAAIRKARDQMDAFAASHMAAVNGNVVRLNKALNALSLGTDSERDSVMRSLMAHDEQGMTPSARRIMRDAFRTKLIAKTGDTAGVDTLINAVETLRSDVDRMIDETAASLLGGVPYANARPAVQAAVDAMYESKGRYLHRTYYKFSISAATAWKRAVGAALSNAKASRTGRAADGVSLGMTKITGATALLVNNAVDTMIDSWDNGTTNAFAASKGEGYSNLNAEQKRQHALKILEEWFTSSTKDDTELSLTVGNASKGSGALTKQSLDGPENKPFRDLLGEVRDYGRVVSETVESQINIHASMNVLSALEAAGVLRREEDIPPEETSNYVLHRNLSSISSSYDGMAIHKDFQYVVKSIADTSTVDKVIQSFWSKDSAETVKSLAASGLKVLGTASGYSKLYSVMTAPKLWAAMAIGNVSFALKASISFGNWKKGINLANLWLSNQAGADIDPLDAMYTDYRFVMAAEVIDSAVFAEMQDKAKAEDFAEASRILGGASSVVTKASNAASEGKAKFIAAWTYLEAAPKIAAVLAYRDQVAAYNASMGLPAPTAQEIGEMVRREFPSAKDVPMLAKMTDRTSLSMFAGFTWQALKASSWGLGQNLAHAAKMAHDAKKADNSDAALLAGKFAGSLLLKSALQWSAVYTLAKAITAGIEFPEDELSDEDKAKKKAAEATFMASEDPNFMVFLGMSITNTPIYSNIKMLVNPLDVAQGLLFRAIASQKDGARESLIEVLKDSWPSGFLGDVLKGKDAEALYTRAAGAGIHRVFVNMEKFGADPTPENAAGIFANIFGIIEVDPVKRLLNAEVAAMASLKGNKDEEPLKEAIKSMIASDESYNVPQMRRELSSVLDKITYKHTELFDMVTDAYKASGLTRTQFVALMGEDSGEMGPFIAQVKEITKLADGKEGPEKIAARRDFIDGAAGRFYETNHKGLLETHAASAIYKTGPGRRETPKQMAIATRNKTSIERVLQGPAKPIKEFSGYVVGAHDADTIYVKDSTGAVSKIRFQNIDAFELQQKLNDGKTLIGRQGTKYINDLLLNKEVKIIQYGEHKGRKIARVFTKDGKDVGYMVAEKGYAILTDIDDLSDYPEVADKLNAVAPSVWRAKNKIED